MKTTIRFNAKEAKDFRATMAKWHDAQFQITDALLQKAERVKNYRGIIASNNEMLAKKLSDRVGRRSDEDLKDEIATMESKIKDENEAMAELRKAQADRLDPALKMADNALYEGYVAYYRDGDRDAYVEAMTLWFNRNGVACTRNDVGDFVNVVGKKKNSARQMYKTGKHNGVYAYTTWRTVFLGELCDTLGDLLPMHKFTYVAKNDRAKK